MPRLDALDGLRGYFLIFMLLHHLPLPLANMLGHWGHAGLGYVQDAQGFVFLSGLVVGVLGTRRMLAGRGEAFAAWTRHRAATLVWRSWLLLVVFYGVALAVPSSPVWWGGWLEGVWDHPGGVVPAALLLLHQPALLDILPQYVPYLLATPALLALVARGHGMAVAACSAGLWGLVQLGWHVPLAAGLQGLLDVALPGAWLRGHFNPLAWQLLYVAGLCLGHALAKGRLDLGRWVPARGGALPAALALLALFALYRAGWATGALPELPAARFVAYADRTELGPLLVLNFMALAYATAWLLLRGPQATAAPVRLLARAARALLRWPPLARLGRHSLDAYVLHVALVYAVGIPAATLVLAPPAQAALAGACVGALFLMAWARERGGEPLRATLRAAGPPR